MGATDALLVWGCQSTLDHRAGLTAEQFRTLGLEPPEEDQERFVTRAEVEARLDQLRRLGVGCSVAPGGSPLVSALAAAAWYRVRRAPCASYFAGTAAVGLSRYVRPAVRSALAFAEPDPCIGGTLALEFRPTSSKLMLSVPDGRWLDDVLAKRALSGIARAVASLRPSRLGVGLGGLNKASLDAVLWLIEEIRSLPVPSTVFAGGSSFRGDVGAQRPEGFWLRLQQVLAAADVVSLSSAEQRQLDAALGTGWVDTALREGRLKLLVRHSSSDASFIAGADSGSLAADPQPVLDVARREATRSARRSLTGLGARFDGVLSAAILLNWAES